MFNAWSLSKENNRKQENINNKIPVTNLEWGSVIMDQTERHKNSVMYLRQ